MNNINIYVKWNKNRKKCLGCKSALFKDVNNTYYCVQCIKYFKDVGDDKLIGINKERFERYEALPVKEYKYL